MMPSLTKNLTEMFSTRNLRPTSNYSGTNYRQHAAPLGLHGERLHQMVVFELREDGSTEYSTMTLRALYNYVVCTITESCRQANNERHEHSRSHRNMQHSLSQGEMVARFTSGYSDNNDDSGTGIGVIFEDEEEREHKHDNVSPTHHHGHSPNPITTYTPCPPTTPSNVPPHLPSLTSSNATPPSTGTDNASLPTPITSNQGSGDSPHQQLPQQRAADNAFTPQPNDGNHRPLHLPSLTSSNATPPSTGHESLPTPITSNQGSVGSLHHDNVDLHHNMRPKQYSQQRAAQTSFTPLPNNGNTHRERLGGYLHPRDMRRLVTPFSPSNEPQLMVRRHVMLLNFDPLRAIVLRDRLLVLVPDGADSLLIALERRVRGGIAEMEDQVFGTSGHGADTSSAPPPPVSTVKRNKSHERFSKLKKKEGIKSDSNNSEFTVESDHTEPTMDHSSNDEWEDIQKMDWAHMPYELQSVDAVLQTVIAMLMDEARKVHGRSVSAMSDLRGDSPHKVGTGGLGEHAQERLRLHKDEVNLMEGRVQGFVRAMNEVLDDDEDMTLMNLSRLLTHPDRFLQPVSKEILHEESDEPELILEAYLQQALSIVNELDLLKGQIMTTEEQISMTLDAIRNRLLYINTLLSVASLCVAVGSFVGSIFGMNLTNHIETEETAFMRVTVGVIVGMFGMWVILSWIFYRAANTHSDWSGI